MGTHGGECGADSSSCGSSSQHRPLHGPQALGGMLCFAAHGPELL